MCLAGALAATPVPVRAAAALITTGCVALPDIDSRRATITRLLGPLGWMLHHLTIAVGRRLYYATRTERDEPGAGTGHRLISHTYLAAAGTALLVAAGTGLGDELLAAVGTGWSPPWGSHAVAVAAWWSAGVGGWWWAWGLAAGIGHAVGVLGDTLTVAGAPCWFPLVVDGQRWYPARSRLPFRANGFAEHALVVPALYVALSVAVVAVLGWLPPLWVLVTTLAGGV